MSGQRHLRLAALIIGALGALSLVWLAAGMIRAGGAPRGWWIEAGFHGLLILTALGLLRGSELARFGAIVLYACAVVIGVGGVLDILLSGPSEDAGWLALAPVALVLAAGVYGLWVLLVSPRVKTVWAARARRDRFALPVAVLAALAVVLCVGWYLDGLSPPTQKLLAAQCGIAAAFAVLVAFLAARNRKTAIRWEFLPLVVAGVALVANLEAVSQLRELRPVAAALEQQTPPPGDDTLARVMPAYAFRMTGQIERVRQTTLARMEAHTAFLGPWPLMEALTPEKLRDPASVEMASSAIDGKLAQLHQAADGYETALASFDERRQRIVEPLAEPIRRRVELRFRQEEEAYRSHYGARVDLLSRAARNLAAMLGALHTHQGRYAVSWDGGVTFEDPAVDAAYKADKAALEELVVWNSRLRAEGAELAAAHPAWRWVEYVD